jgi:nicotinamidase-related amidase
MVGELFHPNVEAAIAAGREQAILDGYQRSRKPKTGTVLFLVDTQIGFIHEGRGLGVAGAVDDTRRTIEWMYRNVGEIDGITVSLDTHMLQQIFLESWWVDANGNHPDPFTVIEAVDVDNGIWRPVFEVEWSKNYVHELENRSKKKLMIWPYHTLIGTLEHATDPSLYEAIAYHTGYVGFQPTFVTKGTILKTENYSPLEPDVEVPNVPGGTLNTPVLNMIATYDAIYVAGQAKSHCVLELLLSFDRNFDDAEMEKLRIMIDCMSSVGHPDIDFEALCEPEYRSFEARGASIVESTSHNVGDAVVQYFN